MKQEELFWEEWRVECNRAFLCICVDYVYLFGITWRLWKSQVCIHFSLFCSSSVKVNLVLFRINFMYLNVFWIV